MNNLVNTLPANLRQKIVQGKSISDSEDDEELSEEEAEASWGKKKKNYYTADTADLEIGQEFEDAQDEEEEAKASVVYNHSRNVNRSYTNPPW